MSNEFKDVSAASEEILLTCAVNNLRKLARVTTTRFNDKLKPTGLRTTQICVMLHICKDEGKTLTSYSEDLGMDLSTLARSIDTLVKSGLVELSSGNRREKLASLTPAGIDKIEEVYPYWLEAQTEFIESFGEQQWQVYLDAFANTH